MSKYKLTNTTSILRLEDGAIIPNDPANTDYAAYLAWRAEGTVPEPADTPDPQIKLNADSLLYLTSTDWYVTRFTETSEPIPEGVVQARAEARKSIVRQGTVCF